MKRKGWGRVLACWMVVLAFGLVASGCASVSDLKRVESMAQQALECCDVAKGDAQKAQAAAAAAEKSASKAQSAAVAAEQSAAKAEAMADKAEAIFMKKMKK